MKNKTVEEQAELYTSRQYVDYGDYNYRAEEQIEDAWLAGFAEKEKMIKETLRTLEQLRNDINTLPLQEQLLKSRDLDRINNKIEVIQSLL